MLVIFVVILLLTIGFQGGSEGVFIGLQRLKKCLFFCSVFPQLEPILRTSQLCGKHYYTRAVFTHRITRHYALARAIGLAPLAASARKAVWEAVFMPRWQ